jgi:hypothetical protein
MCLSLLVFAWLILSTLKMKAACSSETSVDFKRITCRYVPEDRKSSSFRALNRTAIAIGFL